MEGVAGGGSGAGTLMPGGGDCFFLNLPEKKKKPRLKLIIMI